MVLPPKTSYRLGLISDTHGYLPPDVAGLFRNVDLILHAGDIGSAAIVHSLEAIAPVIVVRGNMDNGPWAETLPHRQSVRAGGMEIHLIHDLAHLQPQPPPGDHVAVVAGHTHRSHIEHQHGVLYVNPGSAGAPRYGEKASVALLVVRGTAATVELATI
ncbi:MAG: metallophosphoesterase family protein [Desulfobacterales bacterium]